jgi:hypothetical protein
MKQANLGSENSKERSGGKKRRESDAQKSSMSTSFFSASSKMLSGMKLGFRNRATSRGSELSPDPSPASSPARSRPAKVKKQQGQQVSSSPETNPTTTELEVTKPIEGVLKSPSPSPPQISTVRSQSSSSTESFQSSHPPPSSAASPTQASPSPNPNPISESENNEEQTPPADSIPEEGSGDCLDSAECDEKIASSPNSVGNGSGGNGNGYSPTAAGGGPGGLSTKNQEYFKKMREVCCSSSLFPSSSLSLTLFPPSGWRTSQALQRGRGIQVNSTRIEEIRRREEVGSHTWCEQNSASL